MEFFGTSAEGRFSPNCRKLSLAKTAFSEPQNHISDTIETRSSSIIGFGSHLGKLNFLVLVRKVVFRPIVEN